jgi:mono/diheme cytochrome c family protein
MSGLSTWRGVRLILGIGALTVLVGGCSSLYSPQYPESLRYPARSDPLVTDKPTGEPFYPIPPGRLEETIARIGKATDQGGLGGKALDPRDVPAEQRKELEAALLEMFGTPRSPKVNVDGAGELDLDEETLRLGSIVYRRNCLHCHGLAGDGRGPTGPWVSPSPRDYRQGKFKFISTSPAVSGRKPRIDDLLRVISHGIDGTSMPAFELIGDGALQRVARYVIHLSLRGQVEFEMLKVLAPQGAGVQGRPIAEVAEENAGTFLGNWLDSNKKDAVNRPAVSPSRDSDLPASIVRGYKLFTDPRGAASCIACHKDFGRQVNFRYDDWGTTVRPMNLTAGTYRGGRRPVDLYWRINGGIEPSGMPAAGSLTPNQTWDLVNFVQALPYPQMLPEQIRSKIYVPSEPARKSAHSEHASR